MKTNLSFGTVKSSLAIIGVYLRTVYENKGISYSVSLFKDPKSEVFCDDLEEALLEGAILSRKKVK